MRRIVDVVAVVALAANVFILGTRALDLIRGDSHGAFLVERSFAEIMVSAGIIAYFVLRIRGSTGSADNG